MTRKPTAKPRSAERLPAAKEPGFTSVLDFRRAKVSGDRIVMVTAYDAWSAGLLADAPVDCLLIGDSVMMVVHGEADTLGATPEIMASHTRAVARGKPGKFIVADMPFLSARVGIPRALKCASDLLRAGANAVKIEGARGHTDVIRHLVESGIPVMGHLGLTPQSRHTLGGFRVQGRGLEAATRLKAEAKELEEAGVFALVLECIPQALASEVTSALTIPTIGIGAGASCDGQVLVLHDLLGFNPDFQPKFVRRFADGAHCFKSGLSRFSNAVRLGKFPAPKEAF